MIIPFSTAFILSYILALLAIAFYTLMERKFLGYFQLRKGPNKVRLIGIPQPFADAIKLFCKEQTNPTPANLTPFLIAPILGLILTLLLWSIYPHTHPTIFILYGALFFLCVSRINVYTIFLAGWCSNSKYALLGALRGIAQTISYEVRLSLILLRALTINICIDINKITILNFSWTLFIVFPLATIWFITNLAETNRTPFDFAEGESELVSGFNVEYRAGNFALIFIAEYANILIISLLTVTFFSGSTPWISDFFLISKTIIIATVFIWIRATLPRIRYDNLIYLTWKDFLPVSLSSLLLVITITFIIQ
jgi:NADH-ubiquinone oxidoreductase chain 1